MTFVNNDEVKEVGCHLLVGFLTFFRTGKRLIERQEDFIGGINFTTGDFSHCCAKGLEVVSAGLVHQDIAVGKE